MQKFTRIKISIGLKYHQEKIYRSLINTLNYKKCLIYADLECLVKRTEGCENNPETSSTTKVGTHTPVDI